ncbi:hypothetical protein SEUCBS139899_002038 [Sporothrix eucalyptigena]
MESWVQPTLETESQGDLIDALFGCSVKLPKLMWAAADLYSASKDPHTTQVEIQQRAGKLQAEIRATKIDPQSRPSVGILCHASGQTVPATVTLDEEELRRRMVATAEIFRHASHIYVYRIAHEPEQPLAEDIQASLVAALELLPIVPDALGPGANLGWCLVVIGAELDLGDQRDYFRSRLASLHLLGIHNTKNGHNILEEVWNHRDLVSKGQAPPERWQDIMQRIGESQILV